MDGVQFVYALNLTRCIGCRKCVHACVNENNQSRTPEIQYIRVLRMPNGSLDIDKAVHDYAPESVPEKGHFYMPVQLPAVQKPPCVKVCPVHAPGRRQMASPSSTMTGALDAGTAKRPARIGRAG